MESKFPDETLRMRMMNQNLGSLRMFEDTFSQDVAQIMLKGRKIPNRLHRRHHH